MSDKNTFSLDELREMSDIGKAVADEFALDGIQSITFAGGDDDPCDECGLRVYPNDPRYATSSAHEPTCSSYQWDRKR